MKEPRYGITIAMWTVLLTTLPVLAAYGDCTKDTECKGDRICVDGRCADSKPNAGEAEKTGKKYPRIFKPIKMGGGAQGAKVDTAATEAAAAADQSATAESLAEFVVWDAYAVNNTVYARAPKNLVKGEYVFFDAAGEQAQAKVGIGKVRPLPETAQERLICLVEPDPTEKDMLMKFSFTQSSLKGPVLGLPLEKYKPGQVVKLKWQLSWAGDEPLQKAKGVVKTIDLQSKKVLKTIPIAKIDPGFVSPHPDSSGAEHNWQTREPDEKMPLGISDQSGALLFRYSDSMRFESGACFGKDCYSCST